MHSRFFLGVAGRLERAAAQAPAGLWHHDIFSDITVAVALMLLGVAGESLAADSGTQGAPLVIGVGKSDWWNFPALIRCDDRYPKIADILPLNQHSVYVVGKTREARH